MTETKTSTRRSALAAFAALAAAPFSATAALSQAQKGDRLEQNRSAGDSTSPQDKSTQGKSTQDKLAQDKSTQDKFMTLFKVVTVRDDIVIGLDQSELVRIGGSDAGAVARALARQGELAVWQYGVRRGPDNVPLQVPTRKIGLLANASLRVEPFSTPYAIQPHD